MPGRGCALLLAAALAVLICGAGCCEKDAPAARVNDRLIMRSELARFINLMEFCNPEAVPPGECGSPECSEQEFLHLLIGFELVNQAAVEAGVWAHPERVEKKTAEMLQELSQDRYGGSPDELHRRRKQLGLTLDDLAILSRYELQAGALFERTDLALEEAELLRFVEENPQMLEQPAAGKLYRFRFAEKRGAEECLAALQRGIQAEAIAAEQDPGPISRGWITGDDPFLEERVRRELFTVLEGKKGCIVPSSGQYILYWIQESRPARRLDFAEVREEAALLQKCLLYEQLYYDLWNEGDIEIYLHRP